MTLRNEPNAADEPQEIEMEPEATDAQATPPSTPPASACGASRLLEFFAFTHLPAHLQAVSKPCGELAVMMADMLPMDPETMAGLRKLLEAKDCFVRASLRKPE